MQKQRLENNILLKIVEFLSGREYIDYVCVCIGEIRKKKWRV